MFLLPITLSSERFKRRMSAKRRGCDTLDCDRVHPRNVCVWRSWFRLCLVGGVSELFNGFERLTLLTVLLMACVCLLVAGLEDKEGV